MNDPRRRRRIIPIIALVLTVVGLGVGALLVYERGEKRTSVLDQADEAMGKGDLERAETLLREFNEANPNEPAGYGRLYQVLMRAEDWPGAQAVATDWLEKGFDERVGTRFLVESLLRQLRITEAEQVATRTSWRNPKLALRTRLIVHEALGTPRHRARALDAAIRLAELSPDSATKMRLLWYAAFTAQDLIDSDPGQPNEAMEARVRSLVSAGEDALRSTDAWRASTVFAQDWHARFRLMSQDPREQDEGAARFSDSTEDEDDVDLESEIDHEVVVALQAFHCSRDNEPEAVSYGRRLFEPDPAPLHIRLQSLRRLAAHGWVQSALDMLDEFFTKDERISRWVRSQILLRGTDDQARQAAALLRGLGADDLLSENIAMSAARVLTARDMPEEAQSVLDAVRDKRSSPAIQIEMAKQAARTPGGTERAKELIGELANAGLDMTAMIKLLSEFSDADPELLYDYAGVLIERSGDEAPKYHLIRALLVFEAIVRSRAPLQPEMRARVIEDLRVATRGDTEKRQLVIAASLAARVERYLLAGELIGRAVRMPGEPADLTVTALQLARSREEPRRSEYLDGIQRGAGDGPAGVIASALGDAVRSDDPTQALKALEGTAKDETYRSTALHLMVALAAERGQFDEVKRTNEALLAVSPDSILGRSIQGQVLTREGKFKELVLFHRAHDDTPKMLVLAQQYVNALWQINQFAKAETVAEACVAANPGSEEAHILLARAQIRLGATADALGTLTVSPPGVRSALMRATILDNEGETVLAERILRRLVAQGAGTRAWELLAGLMLDEQQRGPEFVRLISEPIEKGDLSKPVKAQMLYIRGYVNGTLHQNRQALADYEAAIYEQPDHVSSLNNAAWAITNHFGADKDRLEQAVIYIERALDLVPNNANILNTASLVYLKSGRKDDALKAIDAALAGAPNGDYMCDRAKILHALERKDEAVKQAIQVRTDYPGTTMAARANKLLAKWRREE